MLLAKINRWAHGSWASSSWNYKPKGVMDAFDYSYGPFSVKKIEPIRSSRKGQVAMGHICSGFNAHSAEFGVD